MLELIRHSHIAIILAALALAPMQAQQAGGVSKQGFEAASIRPSKMTPGCFSMLPPGGTQYEATCITLRNLIQMAFKADYIDGGGHALDSLYDLRASTPNGKPWTVETVRPMMQQLLIERFHLTFHAGKRELSGYGMTVAKGGPKLKAVAPESIVQGQKAGEPSQNFSYPGHIQGRGLDATGIAGLLSVVVRMPVVDQTGIAGIFNVDVNYAPDDGKDSDFPSLFTAIEEQLGLKLKREKVSVDTLVIDHVDDAPTAN